MKQKNTTNASAETFRNSLCRDIGHHWVMTAAANFRVCRHERCTAAQYLVDGQWVNVTQKRPKRDPLGIVQQRSRRQPLQTTMWNTTEQ